MALSRRQWVFVLTLWTAATFLTGSAAKDWASGSETRMLAPSLSIHEAMYDAQALKRNAWVRVFAPEALQTLKLAEGRFVQGSLAVAGYAAVYGLGFSVAPVTLATSVAWGLYYSLSDQTGLAPVSVGGVGPQALALVRGLSGVSPAQGISADPIPVTPSAGGLAPSLPSSPSQVAFTPDLPFFLPHFG